MSRTKSASILNEEILLLRNQSIMFMIAFRFGSITLEYFLSLYNVYSFYLCPMENRNDKKTEFQLKKKRIQNESKMKNYQQSFLEPVW